MKVVSILALLLVLTGCGPDRWVSGDVTLICDERVIIEGADWVNYPTNSNAIPFAKGGVEGFYRIKGGETCYVENDVHE